MTTYLNELDDHVIELSNEDNPIDNDDLNTLEFKLLNLISNNSLKNYTFLCNIGQIIKSANCFKNPYSIWVDLCKRANSRNYEIFNTFKPTSYTIKSIHYFAKQDDIQRYHTLMRLHNIQADEQIVADTLNIDRRYLLDKDKLLDDQNNETICDSINTLFNDNSTKSLSIKSPYDTGKTQLLKQVLTKFKPKRVFWPSYRKTLTYDIYSHFNRFGFNSYLDHHSNAYLIIFQVESLPNIDNVFLLKKKELRLIHLLMT